MALAKIRPLIRLTEEQAEYAKELVEEALAENDIDEDPDEVFAQARKGDPVPLVVAKALVGTDLFEGIAPKPSDTGDEKKVVNITLKELEGLTTREKIRRCFAAGMEKADIHGFLGIRAQMVHNTLNALAKKDTSIATCRICGRPLRDEESIRDGVGPICQHRV
jgi:rubrerythrin